VIACYARLERALAAAGFPRRRAETQVEHLTRILGELDIETGAVRRLNDLFLRAKFSHHEVDSGMKEEAIAALVDVRDELRASEERRRELELSLLPGPARS
jgi:signal transduction histidine kinase